MIARIRTVRSPGFLARLQRLLLIGSDQRVEFLLGLLPDFPYLLLFLLRSQRRVLAHCRDLRVRVEFNRVALLDR